MIDNNIQFTFSGGLSCCRELDKDERLYSAKGNGKNQMAYDQLYGIMNYVKKIQQHIGAHMKRILALVLLITSITGITFAAPNSIYSTQRTVKINNQNKKVNLVTVDLTSPDIELGVTIANDKIGTSEDPSVVYLFTPERGNSINLNGGTAIEVIDNKISKITKDPKQTKIPKNGYIIYYGSNPTLKNYVNARFEIDSTIDFYYQDTLKFDT